MIKLLLFPEKRYERQILNFQNIVRIYGLISQETLKKLTEIFEEKSIPILDYNRVERELEIFSKYNKYIPIKPFPHFIKDMNRHSFLQNRSSLVASMKKQLVSYLKLKVFDQAYRDQILLHGIELYNFNDLSKQEIEDLIRTLKIVLLFPNTEKSHKNSNIWLLDEEGVINKIFTTLEENEKLGEKFFQNFMKTFLLIKDFEKAQELFDKVGTKIKKL